MIDKFWLNWKSSSGIVDLVMWKNRLILVDILKLHHVMRWNFFNQNFPFKKDWSRYALENKQTIKHIFSSVFLFLRTFCQIQLISSHTLVYAATFFSAVFMVSNLITYSLQTFSVKHFYRYMMALHFLFFFFFFFFWRGGSNNSTWCLGEGNIFTFSQDIWIPEIFHVLFCFVFCFDFFKICYEWRKDVSFPTIFMNCVWWRTGQRMTEPRG